MWGAQAAQTEKSDMYKTIGNECKKKKKDVEELLLHLMKKPPSILHLLSCMMNLKDMKKISVAKASTVSFCGNNAAMTVNQ